MTSPRRHTLGVLAVVLALVGLSGWVAVSEPGLTLQVRALAGLGAPGLPDQPGAHHAFLQTQPDGVGPVGWDPCRPIPYVVNPAGAPPEWHTLITEALGEVSAASGLRFTDTGTTEARDFAGRGPDGSEADPVLIGWAEPVEVPALAGDVAGIGGAVSVLDGDRRRFRTGSVAFDRTAFDALEGTRGGAEVQLAIVLHELGHVVGLAHVSDPGELMYAGGVPRPFYGPGDREGLAELGTLPCR